MDEHTQNLGGTASETNKPKSSSGWLKCISLWSVWAAIFLIPLFFLPSTANPFDQNKALLFGILTVIAALAWLGRIVFYRTGSFVRTPLDLPIMIFGLLYAVTTFFSKNWYASLVGQTGYVHNSTIVVLMLIIWYFLLTNLINSKERLRRAIEILLSSGFVVSVLALIYMLGGRILHWDFMQSNSFNTVFNSNIILGLFLISLVPFQLIWLVTRRQNIWRWFLVASLLAETAAFVLIDANEVWYALIGVLVVVMAAMIVRTGKFDPRWVILPTIMLIISLLLVFIDASSLTKHSLPSDIILDQGSSAKIAGSVLSKAPLYGTGPGLFSYAFNAYRPVSFNNTSYWSLGFIKGGSEFWQMLVTTGVIATGVYILVALIFLISIGRKLWRERSANEDWLNQAAPYIAWLVLLAFGFYYPYSFVLAFLFWTYLALGMRHNGMAKDSVAQTAASNTTSLVSSLAFSVVAVLSVAFVYYGIRLWMGDYHYARGNADLNAGQYQSAQKEYSKAIDNISRRPEYYFGLAQSYIEEVTASNTTDQAEIAKLRDKVTAAIAAGNSGIDVDQNNVSSYQAMVGVYQQLNGFSQPSQKTVVELYDKLMAKNPNNPLVWLGSGDALVAYGQVLEQNMPKDDETLKSQYQTEAQKAYTTAADRYQRAGELKPDYQTALLRKAALPELTGDDDLTLTQVGEFLKKYPNNIDAQYEMSQLYLKKGDKAKAKEYLVAVLNLNPQHANAGYQLGSIVMEEGDKETAKALFTRVFINNQTNQQVRDKLTALGVNPDDLLK
ncbi:MAG: hypothetical protein WC734_05480 [Patescibacteria group bacterium]|jgi:tetratricopeptide (TPR) repeat protein